MADKHTRKEVMEYVREQLDAGHPAESIKAHLINYGHSPEEIDSIFDELLKEEEKVKSKTVSRAVEILYVVIFVIFIFWVGASAKSPGETVIFGFSPTLLYIILTIVLLERMKKSETVLTILPIALAFLFFIVGRIGTLPFLQDMEIGKLAVLNLMLSYIFLFAMRYSEIVSRLDIESLLGKKQPEEESEGSEREAISAPPRPEEYVQVGSREEESLPKLIESIESNCKALNSVIGRVYRRSNGGTSLMRDLIKVKSEWYNEYNHLKKSMDMERIVQLTDKIEKRLNSLFRTEKEVFGRANIKNLERDSEGNSRIIDVLRMNDEDPVDTYLENALILCGKIKSVAG